MKGCAFSALLSFLALLASIAGVATVLQQQYGVAPADGWGVSVFSGLFFWITGNLVISAAKAWRERASIAAGIAGTPPVDGRQVILAGHIEPSGPPLIAPLSGRECIAYTFEIYEMRGSGKSRTKVTFCDGVALTPSLIVTRSGSYRLLTVPDLVCDASDLDRDAALARAATLMQTTPVEEKQAVFSRPEIEKQWTDDDGSYRHDRRHVPEDVSLEKCVMIERQVERGARVCVFGQYAEAKRAIVGDPNDWSKSTRIMKGDPDSIARQLRASIFRRLLGAVICGGGAAGLIAAFVNSLG